MILKYCEICDFNLQNHIGVEIVSGTARGADQLGESYAKSKGYNLNKIHSKLECLG